MREWVEKLRLQVARYRWLREYYTLHHLQLNLRGCPFRDAQGGTLGYLEELRLHQGRLHLRGWTLAREVTIRHGDILIRPRPNEERADVAAATGCEPQVGFKASLPYAGNESLHLELGEGHGPRVTIRHPLPLKRARLRAHLRLRLRFWRDVLPLLPMVLRGLSRQDTDLHRRIKTALRLGQGDAEPLLNPAFLSSDADQPLAPAASGGVVVIMPIYNAFDLLPEALDRVVANTELPWRLVLIEDGSTDHRVRPWLRGWVERTQPQPGGRIELLENHENLGFIRTVNRGFDHIGPGTDPVILLNSDAMVPPGWASRLIAPLANPKVATTTPMSNDAEIFTAPVICARTPLAAGQGDQIDADLRSRIASTAPPMTAPTGVGFCMAIRRDWLARIGSFDTGFGRGYGEEVDWCRRAALHGGLHVAVPNLFVEHRGGASFQGEKLALVQKNNAIISNRYPGYDRSVQEFIRDDPLATPRLVAALAWADHLPSIDHIPVYVAHSMGGGAENYLQERVRRSEISVVLRFGGAYRCRIEFDAPSGRLVVNTDDLDLVVQVIAPVARKRIIYSCGVGDPDLSALPSFLLALSADAPLDLLFHDYLPISPSYTLLDSDGVYRGVPDATHTDTAHCYRRPDGSIVTLSEWRRLWGEVIDTTDLLVAFSATSAEIVATAYPQARDRLHLQPHELLQEIPPIPPPENDQKVIGVLGAIGPQKGAGVLAALSRQLRGNNRIGLALIGRIAPGYTLAGKVPLHGTYQVEDIPALTARYGITHWLIPSIWPETFSYTVHECLATGLPTMAFNLGAQGAAVRRAKNGIALPWEPGLRDAESLARLVINALDGPTL